MIIAPQALAPSRLAAAPPSRAHRCGRVDRDPVLCQQVAQPVVLIADRRRGQGMDQRVVDATEPDALIDELLALVDSSLNRAIVLNQDDIGDHQNQGDTG